MLKLSSKITFNAGTDTELIYTYVNDVSIVKSWSKQTGTGKIVIPRKIESEGKDIAIGSNPVFFRGSTVKVELGYDDNLKAVFEGFISRVKLTVPIELEVEDQMYSLKKKQVANLSYASVDLKTLIKDINTGVTNDINQNQELGKVRISNNATVAQVLDYIRKEYSIYSYFQDGKLRIGRPYYKESPTEYTFGFEDNIIEDSLEYMNDKDVKIKVRAYGIRSSDNKIVEAYWPSNQAEGEQTSIKIDNLGSASDYEALAKRHYEAQKYTGYRGTFTTFGAPLVSHGDIVKFKSAKYPERETEKYLVKQVELKFGVNGYRQVIEVGEVVA